MNKIIFTIALVFYFSGFGQDQKNVVLLDNWVDTTIERGLEEAIFNDVWGFDYEGNKYCAFGSSIGTHIFQIADEKIIPIDFEPGKYQNKFVEHRDFKVYKNYLYGVCDEGTSSLQIFDLSYLPDSIHKVYDSDAFFQICHNIYIDTVHAKLYACGPNNLGMQVLDISNPVEPTLNYMFNELDYVHDCYVRNDTAFLNAGFDGLHVYDFSSAVPTQLGILDFYPNQGYNHSGWLSPDGNQYAFIDETQGTRVRLCEWETELSSISIVRTFGTEDYADFVPHNIVLLDNLAFVSYYNEGFRIFDVSSGIVEEIGSYDTFLEDTAYKLNGAWGVYVFEEINQILIADRQSGLYLFSFPINVLNTVNTGTYITSMPLLDENSYLIPRDHLDKEELTFTISTIEGKTIYFQESFLNYVNVPITLATGVYVFSIYDRFGKFLEQGKFVKAN